MTRKSGHDDIPCGKIRKIYGIQPFRSRLGFRQKSGLEIYQMYLNMANFRLNRIKICPKT